MAFSILPVKAGDVDSLVRKVDYPAHQDGPLHRLMFESSKEQQGERREDEIRWSIDGLLETVHREDETLYKACGVDGLPVGLIGWTTAPGVSPKDVNDGNCSQNGPTMKSRSGQGINNWDGSNPPSLNVTAWLAISRRLRDERHRVLQSCQANGLCRITFMAVDPNYQRQGVGSTLMETFCNYVDENALDAFVLSSPAGIRLYSKFGFKAVGIVETEHGNFTSMLRTSGFHLSETITISL